MSTPSGKSPDQQRETVPESSSPASSAANRRGEFPANDAGQVPVTASTDSAADVGGPGTGPVEPGTKGPDGTGSGPDEPDVGFTLTAPQDPAEQARNLLPSVARTLVAQAPAGWLRVDAVFASTAIADAGTAIYTGEQQQLLARTTPSPEVMALVREHRQLSAGFGDGPWWRLLFTLTSDGRIEADYDFGAEPFPDDQLFAPEVYRADLETYPRETLPVWLAAHIGHGGRQLRPPEAAAEQARADREAGIQATALESALPPFPVMAARWAVLSAAFVAARSEWGPRLMPALRWFEGAKRSGCSLYALPGGRAVLSGGKWDAPELDAAYNRGAPLPDLYRGAPEWVADPVLNRRASNGLLSFCFWWDGIRWYHGRSPELADFAEALPGVWSSDSVARIVVGVLGEQVTDAQRTAVGALIAAAEISAVTRGALAEVFGDDGTFDLDNAYYQLLMGGVTAPEPLPEAYALERVSRYLVDNSHDSAEYPASELRAERLTAGWMVYVPVPPGEMAIGRAIFYLADDGVLERSSSSVAPVRYVPDFERRFRERNRALV